MATVIGDKPLNETLNSTIDTEESENNKEKINLSSSEVLEERYVLIIKYLNYQRLKINNNLLEDIKIICNNEDDKADELNVNTNQLSQIRKLHKLLKNMLGNQKQEHLHYYYIFIILNLTPTMIKNITRIFLAKLYLNYQEKTVFNYMDIIHRNNYLNDLISILEDVSQKDATKIDFFVEILHNFFT